MDLTVTGFKEVDNMLRNLPKEANHQIIGTAIAKSTRPLESAARARVKRKTGNLFNSIGTVKQTIKKANEIGEVRVGPRISAGKKAKSAGQYQGWHGHLVEYGTQNRPPGGWYARFRNAHTTSSKPHPFMKPAWEATKDQVLGQVKNNIAISLRNAMRRLLRKQGSWNG